MVAKFFRRVSHFAECQFRDSVLKSFLNQLFIIVAFSKNNPWYKNKRIMSGFSFLVLFLFVVQRGLSQLQQILFLLSPPFEIATSFQVVRKFSGSWYERKKF